MRVLLTGVYGRCGTAILEHLYDRDEYEWTLFSRSDRPDDHEWGGYETNVGTVQDREAVMDVVDDHDAIVHLAAYPSVDSTWEDVHEPNIIGQYNVLDAARKAETEKFVFASTNHVVGMYETTLSPELYEEEYGLVVDHTSPVRPDSFYGASKAMGEALGRFYIENFEYPQRFYSLRICNVSWGTEDDPAAYARELLEEGVDPDDEAFVNKVRRKMAMWHSRRDFAHLVDCCLQDDTVEYDTFYGVSDNANRWFDLEHARSTIGYRPEDRAEDQPIPWDGLE